MTTSDMMTSKITEHAVGTRFVVTEGPSFFEVFDSVHPTARLIVTVGYDGLTTLRNTQKNYLNVSAVGDGWGDWTTSRFLGYFCFMQPREYKEAVFRLCERNGLNVAQEFRKRAAREVVREMAFPLANLIMTAGPNPVEKDWETNYIDLFRSSTVEELAQNLFQDDSMELLQAIISIPTLSIIDFMLEVRDLLTLEENIFLLETISKEPFSLTATQFYRGHQAWPVQIREVLNTVPAEYRMNFTLMAAQNLRVAIECLFSLGHLLEQNPSTSLPDYTKNCQDWFELQDSLKIR